MLEPQKAFSNGVSRSTERFLLWTTISILVLSNLLTVINDTFQQSVYNLLSHVPVEGFLKNSLVANKGRLELDNRNLRQEYDLLTTKWNSHRSKVNAVSKSVIKRSAKNAAKNVSSIIGEAVPYIGTALIVSVTVDDVLDACNTIKDMNEMATFLQTETDIDEQNKVCGTEVPTPDEIMASAKQDVGNSINRAKEQVEIFEHNVHEIAGGILRRFLHE